MNTPEPLRAESAFIRWVRKHSGTDQRVPVGIGDDAAVLRLASGRPSLVATDTIIQGIHFELAETSPAKIGHKAMAVNLSDLAAMAGVPLVAVTSLALPRAFARQDAEALYLGMLRTAEEFEVAIVGGDTNASPAGLIVSVTVLGEATERGPVCRSGARPGDWLMASGSFGGSILGKHLEFAPRVPEALLLHQHHPIHSMIDVSDSLAADLGHLAQESHCGALLMAAAIPISDAARKIDDGRTALEHALGDGEDFELLFTMAPPDGKRLLANPLFQTPVTHIGQIIAGDQLWLETEEEGRRPLEAIGYDHFRC